MSSWFHRSLSLETHLAVGFSLSYQRRIINGFSCWGDLEWESSPAASWHTCLRGAELHFLRNYEGAQVTWSEETVPIEQLGEVWSEHLIGPTHDAPQPPTVAAVLYLSVLCSHRNLGNDLSRGRKRALKDVLTAYTAFSASSSPLLFSQISTLGGHLLVALHNTPSLLMHELIQHSTPL